MAINPVYLLIGGVVSVLALGTAVVILADRPGTDMGAAGQSEIRGTTPNPANDTMKPVGRQEADRRAVVNQRLAEERRPGENFVAQPVIAEARGPQRGEMPDNPPTAQPAQPLVAAAQPARPPATAPPPETIVIYRDVPTAPVPSPDQVAAIAEQIKTLLKPAQGGFAVRAFDKGERPLPQSPVATGPFGPGVRHAMVARTGDVAYALLDRGFNSDDPAAPVFATITDLDAHGQPGPLNGVRLMGQIVYSATQASIRFGTLILQDGRQAPTQAVAITVDQARTGVADDVDEHTLSRYANLVVASLIQGAGQLGQQLTQQNTYTVFGNGYAVQSGQGINWPAAGMGMAMPLGQALTAVAARNFNQPPTLSSPTNFPIGIVFLQPIVLPVYGAGSPAAARGP